MINGRRRPVEAVGGSTFACVRVCVCALRFRVRVCVCVRVALPRDWAAWVRARSAPLAAAPCASSAKWTGAAPRRSTGGGGKAECSRTPLPLALGLGAGRELRVLLSEADVDGIIEQGSLGETIDRVLAFSKQMAARLAALDVAEAPSWATARR